MNLPNFFDNNCTGKPYYIYTHYTGTNNVGDRLIGLFIRHYTGDCDARVYC